MRAESGKRGGLQFQKPRVPGLIVFMQFAQNLHHVNEDRLWFVRVAVRVDLGPGMPHSLF